MVRADLIVGLIKCGMLGDKSRFRRYVESIIVEERAKKHTVLADQIEKILWSSPNIPQQSNIIQFQESKADNYVFEIIPKKRIDDLILSNEIRQICSDIVEEQHRAELLRSYNLEPRNRILLIGPPGNGKTSLAEALAESLMASLLIVRYDGIIGTYLGETAVRLRKLIEYARTRRCVLFFDEFETLGKERGDTHETGEIKRVVSSLLLQIDSLPSHVVVIGATNHQELLDRAVWRRFQIRLKLEKPTPDQAIQWFKNFEKRTYVSLGYSSEELAKKRRWENFSELEEFGTNIIRKHVLSQSEADMASIIKKELQIWDKKGLYNDQ